MREGAAAAHLTGAEDKVARLGVADKEDEEHHQEAHLPVAVRIYGELWSTIYTPFDSKRLHWTTGSMNAAQYIPMQSNAARPSPMQALWAQCS